MESKKRTIVVTRNGKKKTSISSSLEDTAKVAKEFAKTLRGGEVVALSGELGAGKTTFVQSLARALGVKESVTSPTFIIMSVYDLPKKVRGIETLCHIDAYRLTHGKELHAIGVEDYRRRKFVVTLIEWPERVAEILPESTLWVEITISH